MLQGQRVLAIKLEKFRQTDLSCSFSTLARQNTQKIKGNLDNVEKK